MATNSFQHPEYSFLNNTPPSIFGVPIETPECINPVTRCLPMSRFFNLAFQVYVIEFGDPIAFINDNRFAVYPVKGSPEDCERPDGYFNVLGSTPPPIMVGSIYSTAAVTDFNTEIVDDIPSPFVGVINFDSHEFEDFEDWNAEVSEEWQINEGDCFHLQVYQVGYVDGEPIINVDQPIICSPCFVREEACYNTTIAYNCNENSYDFFFTSEDSDYNNFSAKIELPFYLKNPQLASEESSYRKSDGSFIKLSERIQEEYVLQTDWIPHDWHRKLKIALSCDTIFVNSPNIRQQAYKIPDPFGGLALPIICKDPYQIEWDDSVDRLMAQGSTKVLNAEALSLYNSNCNS